MIVLTVMIAVATFVSALSLRSSVRETAIESYRAFSGKCELEATLSEEYSTYYLTSDSQLFRSFKSECEKYGELYAGYHFYASIGSDEGFFAEIYATDIDRLSEYNAIRYSSGKGAKSRTGIVLSAPFAERLGADVGDYLTATRYGAKSSMTLIVTGIAETTGIFRQADVLCSEEAATRLLSLGDGVKVYNRFFVDLSDQKMKTLGVNASEAKSRLSEVCPLFELASPVAERNVEVTLSYQSTLLFVIVVIVAVLGTILIYTAVSLVMKNRVATAALFKSVGATDLALTGYLLAEVLLYGLVGALLGVGASYGVSALFAYLTGAIVSFSVGWGYAFLGLLFGVLLALLSALIPVMKLAHSPLYDMLHEDSPILSVKVLPVAVCGGLFVTFFLWTAFATVSTAFAVGIFAFFALVATLFTGVPLAISGISSLVARVTRDRPRLGRVHIAASGAKHDRHTHSGARLLAIAIMAVVSVAVLLGEANHQLSSFNDLFRAEIVISADSASLPNIAAEVSDVEGVSGGYLAYIATRCPIEGNRDNTVTLLAAHGQEYEKVFRASEFGVDVSSFAGSKERKAAIGGGLALKLNLSIGDTFTIVVDGEKRTFILSSIIDTPLTVVFTDLLGLGLAPNVCLAEGTKEGYSRLAERYALEGTVYTTSDAFGYVTDLAVAYMKVFTLFEVLVFVFAFAGYINTAIAAYRDRKRERELLRSAGASKGDVRRLVIAENAIVILSASIIGALCSLAVLYIVQNMLKTLGLYFALIG